MTLKTHFNSYRETGEQNLLEDLVVEYIQTYGQEILYLPRRRGNFNGIYHDDDLSYFDTTYPIEMYIKTFDDRTFASKFDVEVRDQVVFSIARRRFELEIGVKENTLAPLEGDLVYFPMNGKTFQIMYAENKPFFYQLGSLQMFDITCELFEYSSERFSTGIPAIDDLGKEHTLDILESVVIDGSGNVILAGDGNYLSSSTLAEEIIADQNDDSDEFVQLVEDENIIDFAEDNPYAEQNPY